MPRESIPSCHQTNPEALRPGHPHREGTAPSRQGSREDIAPSRRCHSVNFPNTRGNRPRKCPDNSNSKNRLPRVFPLSFRPPPRCFLCHPSAAPSFLRHSIRVRVPSRVRSAPRPPDHRRFLPSTLSSPLSNPLRRCHTCRLSNISIADPRFQALAPPYQWKYCFLAFWPCKEITYRYTAYMLSSCRYSQTRVRGLVLEQKGWHDDRKILEEHLNSEDRFTCRTRWWPSRASLLALWFGGSPKGLSKCSF